MRREDDGYMHICFSTDEHIDIVHFVPYMYHHIYPSNMKFLLF